jgi:hypothetical protein
MIATALLFIVAAASPVEHVERISTAGIVSFHIGDIIPNGQLELFVLRSNGDTLLVEFDTLRLVGDVLEAVLYLEENPTIFRSSYTDANGLTHEIVTNCGRFPANGAGAKRCAEEHARGIEAMLTIFPKKLARKTDIDFEEASSDRDIKKAA